MYRTYISDVLKQFDEITKLFAIENKMRIIRRRELLPIPTISPHESKIENKKDKDKILDEVDDELTKMLQTARNIELNYEKEKEARNKEQQARLARQKTGQNSTLPQSMQAHPSKTPTQPHRQVQTSTNRRR